LNEDSSQRTNDGNQESLDVHGISSLRSDVWRIIPL
jgi:hypothetical protein